MFTEQGHGVVPATCFLETINLPLADLDGLLGQRRLVSRSQFRSVAWNDLPVLPGNPIKLNLVVCMRQSLRRFSPLCF